MVVIAGGGSLQERRAKNGASSPNLNVSLPTLSLSGDSPDARMRRGSMSMLTIGGGSSLPALGNKNNEEPRKGASPVKPRVDHLGMPTREHGRRYDGPWPHQFKAG